MSRGRIPPATAAYRVPLTGRVVTLPSGCPCCRENWEPRDLPAQAVTATALAPCEGCRRHAVALASQLAAILVAGLILSGLTAAWLVHGELAPGPLVFLVAVWGAGMVPLWFQPWLFPLPGLRGHRTRRTPLWIHSRRGRALELQVTDGELAAWLARQNAAVPRPVAGDGGLRGREIPALTGGGGTVTGLIGALALALTLLRP